MLASVTHGPELNMSTNAEVKSSYSIYELMIGISAAAIALIAIVIFLIQSVRGVPAKDIWPAVSSLATLAAVIVALGIATVEGIRRRSDEETLAVLGACALTPRLGTLADRLRIIEKTFEKASQQDIGAAAFSNAMDYALNTFFELDLEQLGLLTPLPDYCAHKLATVQGCIAALKDRIEHSKHLLILDDQGGSRIMEGGKLAPIAAQAAMFVDEARQTMSRVRPIEALPTSRTNKQPTDDERSGDPGINA